MKRSCLSALALAGAVAGPAWSADHVETPRVTADPPADIADVYFWRPSQAETKLALGVTFGGRSAATAGGVRIDGPTMFCDRNVLYVFNIDNTNDNRTEANIQVLARLARNGDGQCGYQLQNVPGTGGRSIIGREGQIATDGASGLRGFAGLVEDPFFFDTCGFNALVSTVNLDPPLDSNPIGDPSVTGCPTFPPASGAPALRGIRNNFDGFFGRNLSGIIFEMDLSATSGSNPIIQVWGETYRFPGTAP